MSLSAVALAGARWRGALAAAGRVAAIMLLALAAGLGLAAAVSPQPGRAIQALLIGPVSTLNRFGLLAQEATILTLVGLAVVVVLGAGQFSLMAEGQIHAGALAAGALALYLPLPAPLSVLAGLAAAGAAGFALGLIPGYLKAHLEASELVSSLMLNVIVQRLYEYVLIAWIKSPSATYNWSDLFPRSALLPLLSEQPALSSALFLAALGVAATWALARRTPFGFAMRMVRANRRLAEQSGIDIRRTVVLAMALSGISAGLAGAYLALGIQGRLVTNISAGLGFEGVVVALMARNNPLAVPLAALLYAYLRVGGDVMERSAGVSAELVRIVQALIILLLARDALRQRGAHADGGADDRR